MKTNKNSSILQFQLPTKQQADASTQGVQMFKTAVGEQQISSTMLNWEQKQHLLVWRKVVAQSDKFNDKNINRELVDFLRRAV